MHRPDCRSVLCWRQESALREDDVDGNQATHVERDVDVDQASQYVDDRAVQDGSGGVEVVVSVMSASVKCGRVCRAN